MLIARGLDVRAMVVLGRKQASNLTGTRRVVRPLSVFAKLVFCVLFRTTSRGIWLLFDEKKI